MRYEITQRGEDVEIRVRDTGERAPRVLASMQECQEGRCGCPTDQYDRVADMDVKVGDGEVSASLHPRAGQQLDLGELRACMGYTLRHAREE